MNTYALILMLVNQLVNKSCNENDNLLILDIYYKVGTKKYCGPKKKSKFVISYFAPAWSPKP